MFKKEAAFPRFVSLYSQLSVDRFEEMLLIKDLKSDNISQGHYHINKELLSL
jgi:hypothetical protein